MAYFQTFNIQRLVDLFKLWSNFWPIFGTLWQNSNTTSTQLWNNFDRSFGQLWLFIRQFWDYIDKTLRRLWDDFETTLRQLWGTLWLLVDVTCHVGSIWQLFRFSTLSSTSLKVKSTFHLGSLSGIDIIYTNWCKSSRMIVCDILLVFPILSFAMARPNNDFSHVSTRLGWSYCTLFKLGWSSIN